MERLRNIICSGLLIVLIGGFQLVHAENLLLQREVVLAYTYNFTKFIDWSRLIPSKQVNLCFYGKVERVDLLESLPHKPVGRKQLSIHKLKRGEDFEFCHVLFIEKSEGVYLDPILERTDNQAILTISMINGFARAGGAIELIKKEDKISFNLNRKTLNSAGLNMSAQIYRLANKVIDQ